ncbi:MAG: YHS domain-containing protein [Acidobacteriia bacterium]|nr:YHS domain-containing protein [Terriglobia bacterium]
MRGLLTLLLYAAFFYLMMRFGCGAHMVHGHGGHGHEGQGGGGSGDGSAKDPVCGMLVPPSQGYAKNHQGRVLHFCSRKCLDSFEAEPQRYVA